MTAVAATTETFLAGVVRAAAVAAAEADDVDRSARFPSAAIAVLREEGALAALVPTPLGGPGLPLPVVARACHDLARGCAATGMVFAMHQIQVGCLVAHAAGSPFFESYLRDLVTAPRLISSATSEIGVGGDLRSSIAAVTPAGDWLTLEKRAPVVSYGAHSDDVLVTCRRTPDAEPNDQVCVLLDLGSAELEQVGTWDPLGMRGTCSPGFVLRARFGPERVVPAPFAEVASRSMVPLSHILWSHVWLGTAGEAFERASAFVRADARRRPGTVPPTAGRLAELAVVMGRMRAEIADATGSYVTACESPAGEAELDTIGHALRINAFKVSVSETAAQICLGALAICGMAGYKNDSSISIGRLLRDALSAALMIGNDRILATDASLLLVHKG